jgi:shikimate dehydrogenase
MAKREKQVMAWINGDTKLVAIFGWPLTYTLSPRIHNEALRLAGLDARYLALPAPDEKAFLGLARGLMASPHFVGANVTNPYKLAALKLVKRLGPAAKAIGAVNTLVRDRQGWVGENTDAEGFTAALAAEGFKLRGKRVLVLGAGGAARAVAWAAAQGGAKRVLVLARRPAQAKLTAALAGKAGLHGVLAGEAVAAASLVADLVVHTLPGQELGAEYGEALMLHPAPAALAFDISYSPRPTAFLKAASRSGWRVADGGGMLVEQGRAAFELWFGKKPQGAPLRALLAD